MDRHTDHDASSADDALEAAYWDGYERGFEDGRDGELNEAEVLAQAAPDELSSQPGEEPS